MLKDERKSYLKLIAALAWPTILEQVLTTAVSYVDTAMVGRLGAQASATIGATMTVNWMMGGIVMALSIGFLSYIARSIGAGKAEMARRVAAQAVSMALLSGTVITVLALSLAWHIPVWMRADEHIRDEAGRYFFIIYIPMIFRSAIITFGTVLRAAGDTRKPMLVNTATNLINVVLNFFLIYICSCFFNFFCFFFNCFIFAIFSFFSFFNNFKFFFFFIFHFFKIRNKFNFY